MLVRVLAMALCLCLSVCLSQVGVLSKWSDLAGSWHVGFFRPILYCDVRKFRYVQKLRVLPSGTLSETLDLENFASIIDCQNVIWT